MARYRRVLYWQTLTSLVDPGIRIFEVVTPLVKSLHADGSVDGGELARAAALLRGVHPTAETDTNDLDAYENVLNSYVDAWKLYYFQKIG